MSQGALSDADLRLLSALQRDASLSHAELAEAAGLSRTSCWRRVQELRHAGLIEGQVTLLDPSKLGFGLLALVSVAMVEHSESIRDRFESHIAGVEEVLECYATTGEWDYLLLVVSRDIQSFDRFLNERLLHHGTVRTTNSSFALRRIKYTTRLPLGGAGGGGST